MKATERKNVECVIVKPISKFKQHSYVQYLLFGNMKLISLIAAWHDSLPWSAFFMSQVPYFALRLGKNIPPLCRHVCLHP